MRSSPQAYPKKCKRSTSQANTLGGRHATYEGRTEAPESEGSGPSITTVLDAMMATQVFGQVLPHGTKPAHWPAGVHELAQRFRLHHYIRVRTSAECRDLVLRGHEVRVSLEVTEEWHNPPTGVTDIRNPDSLDSRVLTHRPCPPTSTAIGDCLSSRDSWGAKWGHNGWGAFSPDVFDRYVIEAWKPDRHRDRSTGPAQGKGWSC